MAATVQRHSGVLFGHVVAHIGVGVRDERAVRTDKFLPLALGGGARYTAGCLVAVEHVLADENCHAQCAVEADSFPMCFRHVEFQAMGFTEHLAADVAEVRPWMRRLSMGI